MKKKRLDDLQQEPKSSECVAEPHHASYLYIFVASELYLRVSCRGIMWNSAKGRKSVQHPYRSCIRLLVSLDTVVAGLWVKDQGLKKKRGCTWEQIFRKTEHEENYAINKHWKQNGRKLFQHWARAIKAQKDALLKNREKQNWFTRCTWQVDHTSSLPTSWKCKLGTLQPHQQSRAERIRLLWIKAMFSSLSVAKPPYERMNRMKQGCIVQCMSWNFTHTRYPTHSLRAFEKSISMRYQWSAEWWSLSDWNIVRNEFQQSCSDISSGIIL